jgi:hypothetical protein
LAGFLWFKLQLTQNELATMYEYRRLVEERYDAEIRLCNVVMHLGEAYKQTLSDMMGQLGILHRGNAADMVIKAYDAAGDTEPEERVGGE